MSEETASVPGVRLTLRCRERMAIPRMIAGLLDLACKVHEDGERAAGFVKALTREDPIYESRQFADVRLHLPDFEEVRYIMGLASPMLVDDEQQEELVAALEEVSRAAQKLHRIVRRDYYSEGAQDA